MCIRDRRYAFLELGGRFGASPHEAKRAWRSALHAQEQMCIRDRVEKSPKRYGGTCINVACIPTKSLVHSAALSAAQGGTFDERAARYAAAIDEKDRVTGLLRGKNYHKLADLPNVEVVDGTASFVNSFPPCTGAASRTAAPVFAAPGELALDTPREENYCYHHKL